MSAQLRIDDYYRQGWPHIEGWIDKKALDAIATAATYQELHGIDGNALEIGVFQGRSFLGICAAMRPRERAVALDIFDDQSLNFDHSGAAANLMQAFRTNVDRYASPSVKIDIFTADSLALRAEDILARTRARCRIISIDGGHTAEHVMNDLALASDILVNGAVIILDDWMSPHWPGVQEGYVRYMTNANRRLAPVFFVENKLFLTTISHQPAMKAYFAEHYPLWQQMSVREVQSGPFHFFSAV
jgi:hypothetical protein